MPDEIDLLRAFRAEGRCAVHPFDGRTLQPAAGESVLCDRGGEYAGDTSGKAGKRVGIASAPGRVEFPDRQRSHPRIPRCQLERLYRLVEGRSGVAAVSILRERGIDEVEDVNVDVKGKRARRETVKRGPGNSGGIGGECLGGGHAQAEPVSLLALPVGGQAWLHPEPRHLVCLKQRPRSERIGDGVHATRQGQRVRQPHPVQGPVCGALRCVDVVMAVEVQQPGSADVQAPQRRHHPQHYSAIPAEHQGKVATLQQRIEPVGQLPHRRGGLVNVLGQRVIPVRTPYLMRQVPVVMNRQP